MKRAIAESTYGSLLKRAVVLALLLAAVPAAADVTSAPRGWNYDEALSLEQTRKAQRGSYFGGTETTKIVVEAFLAPGGGSLFVTRAEAKPGDLRDGVATRALFALSQSAVRHGGAEIEASAQRADPANKQFEATIAWRDPTLALREHGRTIVVADATHLVAITGECMHSIDGAKDVEQACLAALAALDPGIPVDQRVKLTLIGALAEGQPSAPTRTPPDRTATASRSARMGEQPQLSGGGRTPMAPMTIAPAKREVDRRPLYLGGGIVVLAAIFWWNRRRRDRFDREDAPATAPTGSEPSSGDDDADADDLQAAARGEAPKDEP